MSAIKDQDEHPIKQNFFFFVLITDRTLINQIYAEMRIFGILSKTLLIILVVGIAASCSEEDSGSIGIGNQSSSKLIGAIVNYESGSYVKFTYDGNRLSTAELYSKEYDYSTEMLFIYSDNKVTLSQYDESGVINVSELILDEAGNVVTFGYADEAGEDTTYFFYNAAGYLATISNLDPYSNILHEQSFEYSDNHRTSAFESETMDGEISGSTEYVFTYSDIENKGSLNVFNDLFADLIVYQTGGFLGRAPQYLVAKVEEKRHDGYSAEITYDYVLDKDGYVTKLTVTAIDSEMLGSEIGSYAIEYY